MASALIAALPRSPAAQEPATTAEPAAAPQTDAAAALEKARAASLEKTRAGQFAEAVPFAQEALKLTEQSHGADALETGVAAHNLGFVLRRANRVAEAQANLERALAIYDHVNPAVHEDTRNVVAELSPIYLRTGRGAEIVALYDRLIERAGREGYAKHVGVAAMQSNAGFMLRALKRPSESDARWREAIAIYEAQDTIDEEPYLAVIEALLDRYQGLGWTEAGRTLVEEKLQALRAHNAGEGKTALWLLNRGFTLDYAAGRFAEAREEALAALSLVERGPSPQGPGAVAPLTNLARAEQALANDTAAEPFYKRAIAILDARGEAANAGAANADLAALYEAMGQPGEAEQRHKRAMELLEGALGQGSKEVGTAAANYGALLSRIGRFSEAEPLLRRSLAIAEAQVPQDSTSIVAVAGNLADLLRQTGREQDAVQQLQHTVAMIEKAAPADDPTLGMARGQLGHLLLQMGLYPAAETQLRMALDIAGKAYGADHLRTAEPAVDLGETYVAMGQPERGRDLLRRALAAQERSYGADHVRLLPVLNALGHLELASRQADGARGIYERAVGIALSARSRIGTRALADREYTAAARAAVFGLIDALWQSGGRADQPKLARALEISQWNTIGPAGLNPAALGAGDAGLAALARERKELTANWQEADQRLSALLAQSGQRNAALEKTLRERLAAIDGRLAALDRELRAKSPRYDDLARPTPLGLEAIRQRLKPSEAALQYTVTPEATYVWLISQDQTRWQRLTATEGDLTGFVRTLRCGLDRAQWTGAGAERCASLLGLPPQTKLGETDLLPFRAERAYALYNALLAPVGDAIVGKDLLIVPSGPLTALPFGVLLAEKPDIGVSADPSVLGKLAWIGRRQPIAMLPSLDSLKTLRTASGASHGATPFLGVGNPLVAGADGTDRRAWARQSCAPAPSAPPAAPLAQGARPVDMLRQQGPLPDTADELCDIAKSLNAAGDAVLLGANASEARLKARSASGALADARIVQFATRGFSADDTASFSDVQREPSLLLTPPDMPSETDDGLLTASEIAALRLDADGVILSTRQSADGSPAGAEAPLALARAFFHAGARSLLVSRWATDKETTVKLITGAIAAMGGSAGPAQALERSVQALIEAGGRAAHPAFWASFSAVGGGGPVTTTAEAANTGAPEASAGKPAETAAVAPASSVNAVVEGGRAGDALGVVANVGAPASAVAPPPAAAPVAAIPTPVPAKPAEAGAPAAPTRQASAAPDKAPDGAPPAPMPAKPAEAGAPTAPNREAAVTPAKAPDAVPPAPAPAKPAEAGAPTAPNRDVAATLAKTPDADTPAPPAPAKRADAGARPSDASAAPVVAGDLPPLPVRAPQNVKLAAKTLPGVSPATTPASAASSALLKEVPPLPSRAPAELKRVAAPKAGPAAQAIKRRKKPTGFSPAPTTEGWDNDYSHSQ